MRESRTPSPARIFGRPALDQIWIGPEQEQALSFLRGPFGGAIKLLLGPPDSGKSTLLSHELNDARNTIVCRGGRAWDSPASCSQDRGGQARDVMVIAVDNAERLTSYAWWELSRLRAAKPKDGYRLDLLLIGRCDTPERMLGAVADGWGPVVAHHLPAPGQGDVGAYISHRLNTAGLTESIFSPGARQLIATLSGGSFVWVNILCQWALLLARQNSIYRVDRRLVESAMITITARGGTRPSSGKTLRSMDEAADAV